jgi:plastocyanin
MRGDIPIGALLAAVLITVAFAPAALTVSGSADDLSSILEYSPAEQQVEPGETVTVDVEVFAGGVTHDAGVDRVNTTLVHDPDVLTITSIEPGPWLAAGGAEVSLETDIDGSSGTARVVQTRDASAGVTGNGSLLTVTLAVAGDATPGEYTLSYDNSIVRMTSGQYQPVFPNNGTLLVSETDTAGEDSTTGRFALGVAAVVALVVGTVVLRRVRAD